MKKLIVLWMTIAAFTQSQAQAPQTANVSRVESNDSVLVFWVPVEGATYNVYDVNRGFALSCPTTAPVTPDQTGLTQNLYADNPSPGWDLIPVTGPWQQRFWCYWISSVVGGKESPKIGPYQVAIGESGYMSLSFNADGPDHNNPCSSAPAVHLPSTNPADYVFQAIYRDQLGVDHEIPLTKVIFNTEGTIVEVAWKLPVKSPDGTMIPWDPVHVFYGTVTYLPLHQSYEYSWAPRFDRDLSYYNQASIRSLVSNPKVTCPMDETNRWQNVTH